LTSQAQGSITYVAGTFHHHLKEGLLTYQRLAFVIYGVHCQSNNLPTYKLVSGTTSCACDQNCVDSMLSMAALQKLTVNKSRKDNLLYQSMQMACDLLDYVSFNSAIKTGDVDIYQDDVPCLHFWFIGGRTRLRH